MKEELGISNSFLRMYNEIYSFSILTNTYKEIKTNDYLKKISKGITKATELIDEFIVIAFIEAEHERARDFFEFFSLKERLEGKNYISEEFRSKRNGWVRFNIIPDEYDVLGDVETFFIATQNIDDEQSKIEEEDKKYRLQEQIVNALSSNFLNVYLIHKTSEEFEVIKQDGYVFGGYTERGKRYNYSDGWKAYINTRVYSQDKDYMLKSTKMKRVLQELKENKEFIGTYRVMETDGSIHQYQFKFVEIPGTDLIINCFQNIDDLIADEKKKNEALEIALEHEKQSKQELESEMKISRALSGVYFATYYANIITGAYRPIKELDTFSKFAGNMTTIEEAVNVFIPWGVSDEHIDMMREFLDYKTLNQRLKYTNSISMEYHGRSPIYEWNRANWIVVKRYADGNVITVLFAVEVISDIVKERMRHQNELTKALNDAKRASAAKTNFLARMSHDIRTPLNGIIGLMEINERHPDDKQLVMANRAKARIAANHLLSLINDVLDMSKLEDGKTNLAHESFDIYDLMVDVFTVSGLRAMENGIDLRTDNGVNLKYQKLKGSPLHLRQIFVNVVTNGIKYNNPGGYVMCSSSIVSETKNTVRYQFVVEDNGIGMSEEFMAKAFEPFAQEHVDARSTYQGTGLGMAISKGLIDAMDGSIAIESKVGVGTKFIIEIPFEIDNDIKLDLETEVLTDISGMNILIVEDNELNLEIAKFLLDDEGANVYVAHDGAEAVALFNQNENLYDVILMDLMMPVMDGLEATRTIRSSNNARAKTIPIIAMTANAFSEDVERCRVAGMNAHLSKPLDIDKVLQAISKYKV